jgi:uncharacterized protein (TIGR02391 family)
MDAPANLRREYLMEFTLTPEEVAGLPLDRLGLAILTDVVANKETSYVNWLQAAERGYSKEVVQVLAEGWAWLHQIGLVAPGQQTMYTPGLIFVTRLGRQVLSEGLPMVRAMQRLNLDLRSELTEKVRPQYLMGEFELACFAAMRAVEVRVRSMIGASDSEIGVSLLKKAFGPDGPLWDSSLDRGEQVARMELFSGAIGFFKNPTSHREVSYDDPVEAAEIIMLADLLMRVLDKIEARRS